MHLAKQEVGRKTLFIDARTHSISTTWNSIKREGSTTTHPKPNVNHKNYTLSKIQWDEFWSYPKVPITRVET